MQKMWWTKYQVLKKGLMLLIFPVSQVSMWFHMTLLTVCDLKDLSLGEDKVKHRKVEGGGTWEVLIYQQCW